MIPICLHDKQRIETYLRRDTALHIYGIGDLDDFFWPYTTWYASEEKGELREVVLLYSGGSIPVMLGLSENTEQMCSLIQALLPILPRRIHTHLSLGVSEALEKSYQFVPYGPCYKMVLRHPVLLEPVDTTAAVSLAPADLLEVEELYRVSYPGNAFDPRMLETGCYVGVRSQGQLVCIAGIHVYSPRYRVAALGNVTTHPDYRGRGLAEMACAYLCRKLLEEVDTIGLNVKADNVAAIACYRRLGFEISSEYEEITCTS